MTRLPDPQFPLEEAEAEAAFRQRSVRVGRQAQMGEEVQKHAQAP